jgi:hypothetical protein
MATRSTRVQLRLTPAELAALEAVRALYPGHSQADTVARLCRLECAHYPLDPGCREALRRLEAERQEPASKAGRPATAARAPRYEPPAPPPERVKVGARFEHRLWTVRAQAEGAPLLCEIVGLERGDVLFRRLRQDGRGLAQQVHRHERSDFEAAHVGKWVEREA